MLYWVLQLADGFDASKLAHFCHLLMLELWVVLRLAC